MMKLALAAAIAAGMTICAAQAQEAPGTLKMLEASTAKPAKARKAERTTTKGAHAAGFTDRGRIAIALGEKSDGKDVAPRKPAAPLAFAGGMEDRGMAAFVEAVDNVDDIRTASIGKAGKEKPELVARARKGKTVKGGAGVDSMVGSAGQYNAIISRYAATYGVSVALAHAVIKVESNYRPGIVGRAGEIGLMQIKPATARGLGYTGSVKELHNPETNIRYGLKYLGMAQQLGGGTTCGTILKYNAGHGARRMNPVSAAYCSKVKRHMG